MSNKMTKANEKTGVKAQWGILQIAVIGVMTAVMCVLAPFSLPIGPVPISLGTLVIYFSLYTLGVFKGTLSCGVYLLLGLVGLPVFSGFSGGIGKLIGPTGGYLIGYLPMAVIGGIIIDRYVTRRAVCLLGLVAATAVCYGLGTAWLAYQAHMDFRAALMAGVIPFIPGDLVKIVIAVCIGPEVRARLIKANLF